MLTLYFGLSGILCHEYASKMIIEDILTLPVLVVGEGRCLRLDLCDWTIYYFPGSCVMDMSDKVKDDH